MAVPFAWGVPSLEMAKFGRESLRQGGHRRRRLAKAGGSRPISSEPVTRNDCRRWRTWLRFARGSSHANVAVLWCLGFGYWTVDLAARTHSASPAFLRRFCDRYGSLVPGPVAVSVGAPGCLGALNRGSRCVIATVCTALV